METYYTKKEFNDMQNILTRRIKKLEKALEKCNEKLKNVTKELKSND